MALCVSELFPIKLESNVLTSHQHPGHYAESVVRMRSTASGSTSAFRWVRSFRTDKSTSTLHPPSVRTQSCGFDRDIVRRRFCGVRQLYFLSSPYKSPLTSYFVSCRSRSKSLTFRHVHLREVRLHTRPGEWVSEWVLVCVSVCLLCV